jgi:NTE family protein
MVFNTEDNWNFPTRGVRFNAEYAYVTNNFAKLDVRDADGNKQGKTMGMSDVRANWRMSFSFNDRFTIQPMLYGRLIFGSVVSAGLSNTIGGEWFGHYIEQQMPFAGIGNMEYIDRQFVAAQLQAQERIGGKSYVLLRVAGGQNAGKLKEIFDHRTMIGVQGAFYYSSLFGPLGATLGYSNHTKKVYFYINLGYEF